MVVVTELVYKLWQDLFWCQESTDFLLYTVIILSNADRGVSCNFLINIFKY